MFRHLTFFIVLLLMVIGNNGQYQLFDECDYAVLIEPGKLYYAFNANYSEYDIRGSSCRWNLTSDRPIKLTCEIVNVAFRKSSTENYLRIGDFDYATDEEGGSGKFTVISEGNRFLITFVRSLRNPSGRFSCSIETESIDPMEPNCQCGWKNSMGIAHTETEINKYTMMAGIIDAQKNISICGATIVNERQVLTAAHCMENRNFTETQISIGDHDLLIGEETNATQLFEISSVRIHPNYTSSIKDYDVALITIEGKIGFNSNVGPVCIPFHRPEDSFAGCYADILGWGSSEFLHESSNILQKTQMSIITNEECGEIFKNLTTRQICTQEPGINPCQLNSGGPLLWKNPTSQRILLLGVMGLQSNCADGQSTQSPRVGSFVRWIESEAIRLGITYCKLE